MHVQCLSLQNVTVIDGGKPSVSDCLNTLPVYNAQYENRTVNTSLYDVYFFLQLNIKSNILGKKTVPRHKSHKKDFKQQNIQY